MSKIKLKRQKGFSLVEVLVVTIIIAIVFTSFYTVSTIGTRSIIESKNRIGAVAFVNEKMEIVRNLEYDKVGTVGSADAEGSILQEEDVTANGRTYHVSTAVHYVDDPMDGTVSTSPADLIPNDYKVVRITVSWTDSNGQLQSASSTSRFVPPGLETSIGGSPLSINVIDGDTLLPIEHATVHIANNAISPPIDDTIQTNSAGNIMLPAARISNGDQLSITKSGYETLTTLDSSATFTPVYGHVSVVAGFLNTYNYFQNKLAKLIVKSIDHQNNVVGGVEFFIEGGKVIGHNEKGESIFSMLKVDGTTGAVSGEKEYSNINSGNYTITMKPNVQYEFVDFDPAMSPMFLSPGGETTYALRVADRAVSALFLEVKDSDTPNAAVAGAKVTLTDGAVDVFTEKLSSLRGVVFYPDGATPLENKTYTLKIEVDGYVSETQDVVIDNLTHVVVNLVRI